MSPTIIEKLHKSADVEWKPIEEVTRYEQPNKYVVKSTNYDDNFATPVLTAGKTFILGYTDDLTNVYHAAKNPVIIFDDFTTDIRWVDFDFKIKSTAIKLITSSSNGKFVLKYIYYWLKSLPTTKNVNDHKRQWISIFSKKIIPIPSLSVQQEIVRILDAFTAHTAELTAELNERKKQYNYYRDKLLTFSVDEVEWKPLGKILKRTGGTSITAAKMKELNKANGALKIFAGGRTFAFVNFDDIPEKDIIKYPSIIVKSRGNIEFDYYDRPFSHKNEFWSYHSENDNIYIKYVYYYIKNKEQYFQNIGNAMQMPQISIRDTDLFLVPVPPLSVQKGIVRKLDVFSILTTSISEGLPREIELRNKQYKYYRGQLLNFSKPDLEI